TLGQRKATQFNAQRDSDGNLLVFPDGSSAFDGDGSVRTSSYFYRYDLAPGGEYLFNADGTPSLQTVVAQSNTVPGNATQRIAVAEGLDRVQLVYGEPIVDEHGVLVNAAWVQAQVHAAESLDAANAKQSVWLADGIDQVTLFYGFNEDPGTDYGRTAANSITLGRGDTAAAIKAKLEALGAIGEVAVIGTGSQADPWQITLVDAQKDGASFRRLAQIMTGDDVAAALAKLPQVGAGHVAVTGEGSRAEPWVVHFTDGANE